MDDEFVVAVEVAFRLGLEDRSRCGRTHLCFYDPIAEGGRAVNNRSVDVLVWGGRDHLTPAPAGASTSLTGF